MSVLDPLSCGFAKVIAFDVLSKPHNLKKSENETKKCFQGRVLHWQFEAYKSKYNCDITYDQFKKRFPAIIPLMQKIGKSNKERKTELLSIFSPDAFKKLPVAEKNQHTLTDCKACLKKYPSRLSYFPATSTKYKYKHKENLPEIKPPKDENVNTMAFKISVAKEVTKSINDRLKETTLERSFGVNISLRKRNELRMTQSYETYSEAMARTFADRQKIATGEKRKHHHTGKLDNYLWDKENCINKIMERDPDTEINFTQLASDFNIRKPDGETPGNKGQVMKELLRKEGVNLDKLQNRWSPYFNDKESFRVRRAKMRLQLDNVKTKVTMPSDVTNKELNKMLKEKIKEGEYTIGEMIVPQKYVRTSLIDGELVNEEILVNGRKIPFISIRRNTLEDQLKYMRLTPDETLNSLTCDDLKAILQKYGLSCDNTTTTTDMIEAIKSVERTRYWACWHDNSTIANHSYLLITLNVIYNAAMFLTNDEYSKVSKEKVNVQSKIEVPHLYILAKCPANDQQLLYSQERVDDILETIHTIQLENGIEVTDKIRFFKGDAPARQFEAGNQKGGNHFCTVCKIHAHSVKNITTSSRMDIISMQDRVNEIRQTDMAISKAKAKQVKYFTGLKKDVLVAELRLRSKMKFSCTWNQKDLQSILDNEVHGIQRLPSLLFDNPESSLQDLNLAVYEVMPVEPLHDLSNHIKNIFQELPHCFVGTEKKEITQMIESTFNNKEAKNSSDYRKSLLLTTQWFWQKKKDHFITNILSTLSEIQEILYSYEEHRSVKKILRLHLLTFHHSILLKVNFPPEKLKSLTERKFYGTYYYSLMNHAPLQFRFLSGISSNTEREEAIFAVLKRITKATSNYKNDHIITNALLRYQMKGSLSTEIKKTKDSFLKSVYSPIMQTFKNTLIPFQWLTKFPNECQSLFENIADFLLDKAIWWEETNAGVLFHDFDTSKDSATCIKVNHVYNSSLKKEQEALRKAWDECLHEQHINKVIPHKRVRKFKPNGDPEIASLSSLRHFNKDQSSVSELFKDNLLLDSFNDGGNNTNSYIQELQPSIEKVDLVTPLEFDTMQDNNQLQNTSTPIIKKVKKYDSEKQSNDDNLVSFKIQVDKRKKTNNFSNSSLMLFELGIDGQLIEEYDNLRKKLKKTDTQNKEEVYQQYKLVLSRIEIPFKSKEEETRREIKTFEMKLLNKSSSLQIIPETEDEKKYYNKILSKLRNIKILKKDFKF